MQAPHQSDRRTSGIGRPPATPLGWTLRESRPHDIDIDIDLEGAVTLAEVERDLGVASTCFVRMGTPYYDPLSATGRRRLRHPIACGHRVGLHHEPGPTARPGDRLDRRVLAEDAALARAADAPVQMVAFHRPSALAPWVLGLLGTLGGLPHAYAPRWFNDAMCLSDGAVHWSHGA